MALSDCSLAFSGKKEQPSQVSCLPQKNRAASRQTDRMKRKKERKQPKKVRRKREEEEKFPPLSPYPFSEIMNEEVARNSLRHLTKLQIRAS